MISAHCASVIAIDGPAGSGKTTIGQLLADRLGYLLLDTGVMYRAAAWAAMQAEVDPDDEQAVAALVSRLDLDILPPTVADGRVCTTLINGQDVTEQLRRPEVERAVSAVAAYSKVRQYMRREQRRIASRGQIIMVGRDIGSIVLPNADLKIYLDASPEVRAQRRLAERLMNGERADYDTVLRDLLIRDMHDKSRADGPLVQVPDAVYVDSTELSIQDTFERVLALVCPSGNKPAPPMAA